MPLTKETALRKDRTTGLAEMQHRHFATVATIIREMPNGSYSPSEIAEMFADRLTHTNSNFDRRRFLLACGKE